MIWINIGCGNEPRFGPDPSEFNILIPINEFSEGTLHDPQIIGVAFAGVAISGCP